MPVNLMNLNHSETPIWIRLIAAVTCVALLASCATAPQTARGPEYAPTASLMREARSAQVPVEKRAADYLQAAAVTAPLMGSGMGHLLATPITQRAVNLLYCFAIMTAGDFGIAR